jgi:hypothetical protein
MSSKTHIVIPDQHSHPQHHNKRFELLGRLINDVQPDAVINLGDGADMPSLSSYDKGTRGFEGKRYKKDIEAALDAQEKLWHFVSDPVFNSITSYYTVGNHEQRIVKATNTQAELEGTIGLDDLELDTWYDEVIEYNGGTPGIVKVDDINYAHFFASGVMGRPVGGEHPATSLLSKKFESCTAGHLHLADWSVRTTAAGKKIMGTLGGCFIEHFHEWAGSANDLWWSGVIIKRGVENGTYDPEFVSLKRLQKIYG